MNVRERLRGAALLPLVALTLALAVLTLIALQQAQQQGADRCEQRGRGSFVIDGQCAVRTS